jgi:CheY-like chemotaxis protein
MALNIILCTDLLFATKITGTAKALHQPFAVARSLEQLRQLVADAAPHPTLIVDLNITGVDPLAAIALAKSQPAAPVVIAFVSHVQADLAAAARQAGADRVLARSAFVHELPTLLAAAN